VTEGGLHLIVVFIGKYFYWNKVKDKDSTEYKRYFVRERKKEREERNKEKKMKEGDKEREREREREYTCRLKTKKTEYKTGLISQQISSKTKIVRVLSLLKLICRIG
jgi:hypothetical protein